MWYRGKWSHKLMQIPPFIQPFHYSVITPLGMEFPGKHQPFGWCFLLTLDSITLYASAEEFLHDLPIDPVSKIRVPHGIGYYSVECSPDPVLHTARIQNTALTQTRR